MEIVILVTPFNQISCLCTFCLKIIVIVIVIMVVVIVTNSEKLSLTLRYDGSNAMHGRSS